MKHIKHKPAILAVALLSIPPLSAVEAAPPTLQAPQQTETLPPVPQRVEPSARKFNRSGDETVAGQTEDGISSVQETRPLHDVSRHTLATGRKLYRDLQTALHATQRHDEIDTRLALDNANQIIDELYAPTPMHGLMQQSAIIREDLRAQDKRPDVGLWLPLQAELSTVTTYVPANRYQAAVSAVKSGSMAARAGNKTKAAAALDRLEKSINYQLALMPLNTLRGDIRSADQAARIAPPYWRGIAEAMSSALSSIQWITTTHASGLLGAYQSLTDAQSALPRHPQRARHALQYAANQLDKLPGAKGIARQARILSRQDRPSAASVNALAEKLLGVVPGVNHQEPMTHWN